MELDQVQKEPVPATVATVEIITKRMIIMKTLDAIMYHIAGHGVIEALADVLRENDPEFVESEKKYLDAVEALRRELPVDMQPTLEEYLSAHEKDIISRVAYAGYLGYRVNIDNFHHPVMIDFVHLDTIDYIKDHTIGHFPVNDSAAEVCDAFFRAMPEGLKAHHDAIEDYFIHMECSGPKLAHYAGYIIANNILPWVEPGYREDWSQTNQFREEMIRFMGYLPL